MNSSAHGQSCNTTVERRIDTYTYPIDSKESYRPLKNTDKDLKLPLKKTDNGQKVINTLMCNKGVQATSGRLQQHSLYN